jgi:hypothetical protein
MMPGRVTTPTLLILTVPSQTISKRSKSSNTPCQTQSTSPQTEQVETAVLSCKDGLLSLQKKLTKIKPCDVFGGWPSVRAFGRRALREIVEDLKDDLTLAVQVLQM